MGVKIPLVILNSALSKKLGGKYALDSKIIWSSVVCLHDWEAVKYPI